MKVSYLIENLKRLMEKHGDLDVMYWCPELKDGNKPVDVVEFENKDIRAGITKACILLGD